MKAIYRTGNDIKVDITIKMDGAIVDPSLVPVTILLWTNRKADAHQCGWDGREWFGGASKVGNAIHVAFDAPVQWAEGEMHGEAVLHYPDAEMPDKTNDQRVMVELTESECGEVITGTMSHVCYGLSAYDLAVQQGFVGTLAEWLASLNGKAAEIESQTEDADGNTVITWADGKTTTVKRGKEGRPGEPGKDGKDGSVLYPTFAIVGGHLIATVPSTESDLEVALINGHLILAIA